MAGETLLELVQIELDRLSEIRGRDQKPQPFFIARYHLKEKKSWTESAVRIALDILLSAQRKGFVTLHTFPGRHSIDGIEILKPAIQDVLNEFLRGALPADFVRSLLDVSADTEAHPDSVSQLALLILEHARGKDAEFPLGKAFFDFINSDRKAVLEAFAAA